MPWRKLWPMLVGAYQAFNRDNGPLLAAAVSFYAGLSLIPLLLVAISISGYVLGSSAEATRSVFQFVDQHLLPTASEPVRQVVDQVVKDRGLIGGFGFLTLLWSASQGVVTLEAAINAIWRRPTRSVLSGRLFALLILFVVGFLLLLTIGITSAQTAVSGIPGLSWLGTSWAVRLAGIAVAIAVSTVMFAVIYRFLPNGGAAWRPSILAGAVAAIAWELAKHGYAWYVGHLADYKSVYGPMGTLIGLVLWVYYSSFLLIYGSELARVCQDRTNAAGDSRRSVAGT